MALRKIGEAVTGTNGKCVIPYTGVGVGRLQMKGQYEEDGRVIQSETYEVLDCLYLDDMSNDTHTRYIGNNGSLAYDSTNKTVVYTKTANGGGYMQYEPNVSAYIGETIKLEADILESSTNAKLQIIQFINSNVTFSDNIPFTNGHSEVSMSLSDSTTRVIFRIETNSVSANDTVSITNLKAYPI